MRIRDSCPIHEDRSARLKELYRNISDGTLDFFREEGARTYRSIDYVIEIEKGRAREIGQIDNEEEHKQAREAFSRELLRNLKALNTTDDQRTVSERSLDIPYKELFKSELGKLKSSIAINVAGSSQGENNSLTRQQIAEGARLEMLKSVRVARVTSHQISVAYLEFRKEMDKDIPKGRVLLAFRAARRIIDRNKDELTSPHPIPAAPEGRLDNHTLGRYLCSALWAHRRSLKAI